MWYVHVKSKKKAMDSFQKEDYLERQREDEEHGCKHGVVKHLFTTPWL